MRALIIFTFLIALGSTVAEASDCNGDLGPKTQVYDLNPSLIKSRLKQSYRGADHEVAQKVDDWNERISEIEIGPNLASSLLSEGFPETKILNEINAYAKTLITMGQNKKLEDLLRAIDFPVNSYEQPTTEVSFLGEFLTSIAILADNPGAIILMERAYQEGLIRKTDAPSIRRWTLDLSLAVEKTPELKRLAPSIRFQIGDAYSERRAKSFTALDSDKLEKIRSLETEPNVENLLATLKLLLPSDSVSVENELGDDATLDITNREGYYSLKIRDPRYFVNGFFNRYYTKKNGFDILTSSWDQPKLGNRVLYARFKNNVLEIMIERLQDNLEYDTSNRFRYQRLALHYDQDNRLAKVEINNGRAPYKLLMSSTQIVTLPERMILQTSHVFFYPYGSEMFTDVLR